MIFQYLLSNHKIRELFRKTGFNPFWIIITTIKSRRWRRWLKTEGFHIVGMMMTGILNWDWTPQGKVFGNDRPNVFGDRRTRCFAQTQSGLVNGLCVWHCIPFYCICWTLLIIYFCLVVKNLFFTYHPSLRRMSLEVIYIYIYW